MSKINYGRVILGGIVAGIIIDIFEYVLNGIYLANDWTDVMQSIGRQAIGQNAIIAFNLMGLAIGLIAVWTYAAIRAQFSPGVKTAVCAALLTWFTAYVLGDWTMQIIGIISMHMMAVLVGVGLVEIVVATVAGAYFYKDA